MAQKKTPAQIRTTRIKSLHACWEKIVHECEKLALVPKLDDLAVSQAVEDYIAERKSFVTRYRITSRIQRHKVAGLMAASIMKFRPVKLFDRDHSPAYEGAQGNEMLAFWHGLAVCAEGAAGAQINALVRSQQFLTWKGDLFALFEQKPSSPEAFALIFETISLCYFPANLIRTPAS